MANPFGVVATWGMIATVAIAPVGCVRQCDDFAAAGLTVHLIDAAGQPICDAEVVARTGEEALPLEASPDCSFVGAWERPGSYVVTATTAGTSASKAVDVPMGACHVEGKVLRIVMD